MVTSAFVIADSKQKVYPVGTLGASHLRVSAELQRNKHARMARLALRRSDALRLEGEYLAGQEKNPGAKGIGPIVVSQGNRNETPTLAQQGISKRESVQSQAIAEPEYIPEYTSL
jgi:hypothetical protein